jgi:DNA-directed RNA polymerase specialized sigma24 family protein
MPSFSERVWWDREYDQAGNRIRDDVRQAAKKKWPQLLALAQRTLNNCDLEAQQLLESVAEYISRYLNGRNTPPHDPSGLLVLKFREELRKFARKQERLKTMGGSKDIEPMLPATEWGEEADRRIFLEELIRSLSKQNRSVLRLRRAGYEWAEIGKMLSVNPSSLRRSFWAEVRGVYSAVTEILDTAQEGEKE